MPEVWFLIFMYCGQPQLCVATGSMQMGSREACVRVASRMSLNSVSDGVCVETTTGKVVWFGALRPKLTPPEEQAR